MAEKPKVNPREISLYSVFADVGSTTPEIRLRPRPDVTGEQILRESTVVAIERLLNLRDLAVEFATNAKPEHFDGFVRDFRRALDLPVEAEKTPGGNVSATIVVRGTKDPATGNFHVAGIDSIELIRDRKRIELPFYLVEGERMLATIVVPGGEGKSDEVVGRAEVVAPPGGTDVTEIKLSPVLVAPKVSPLAIGCSTCGKTLEPGERPAVEETAESAGSSPRRWKCAACVMSGLVGSGPKPPEGGPDVVGRIPAAIPDAAPAETAGGEEVEKFDEATGPMETRG